MIEGLIHYDIPLDDGEVARIHVPLPVTALDEFKIRHAIAFELGLIERLELETRQTTETQS